MAYQQSFVNLVMSRLTRLALSHDPYVQALPAVMPRLVKLSLYFNARLNALPVALPALTHLDLVNNSQLVDLSTTAMPQLPTLRLGYGLDHITALPRDLHALTALSLDSSTALRTLPLHLTRLEYLNLGDNDIITILPTYMPSLVYLRLGRNTRIQTLPPMPLLIDFDPGSNPHF
jgi:hypothetical protein